MRPKARFPPLAWWLSPIRPVLPLDKNPAKLLVLLRVFMQHSLSLMQTCPLSRIFSAPCRLAWHGLCKEASCWMMSASCQSICLPAHEARL
jgi:hypothetical protein